MNGVGILAMDISMKIIKFFRLSVIQYILLTSMKEEEKSHFFRKTEFHAKKGSVMKKIACSTNI